MSFSADGLYRGRLPIPLITYYNVATTLSAVYDECKLSALTATASGNRTIAMAFWSFSSPVHFCIFVFVASFSVDGLHSERLLLFNIMLARHYSQQFGDLTGKNDIYHIEVQEGGQPQYRGGRVRRSVREGYVVVQGVRPCAEGKPQCTSVTNPTYQNVTILPMITHFSFFSGSHQRFFIAMQVHHYCTSSTKS